MSDENKELLNMIKELQANSTTRSSGWARKSQEHEIKSVMIPIAIQTPEGKIRVYLEIDGAAASSVDALMDAIESLAEKGLPLDTWKPKTQGKSWGGNGGGNGNYNNNYNRNSRY